MKKKLLVVSATLVVLVVAALRLYAQTATSATPVYQTAQDFTAAQAVAHSHATGVTLTITPGSGNYVYVTGVDVSDCATGTAVTAAAPTYITTTGFGGTGSGPQYQIASGVTAGLAQPTISFAYAKALRSATAGANVTFVMPAFATNQVVSLNVYYYIAP